VRQLWHDLNQVHVTLTLGHVIVLFLVSRLWLILWMLHKDGNEYRQRNSQQNPRVRRRIRREDKHMNGGTLVPGMWRR